MVNTCSLFLDKRAYSGGDVYLGNCANHVFCHYYLSSRHVTLNAFHHLLSFSFLFIFFKRFFSLLYFSHFAFSFFFVLSLCIHIINPSSFQYLQLHHESIVKLWESK